MKGAGLWTMLTAAVAVLFLLNLACGSVNIAPQVTLAVLTGQTAGVDDTLRYIILESRLPQALTAMLAGGALAVSGLMLQTAFRNALADPYVFGINGGAGLGVALVMLALGGTAGVGSYSIGGFVAVVTAAFAGAMAVIALIFFFSTMVRNSVMLLIIGIMTGYLASSAISILSFMATAEGVKSYMVWGMGSFGGVPMSKMGLFAPVMLAGLVLTLLLIKPLNALLLGERYARNLGVSTGRLRSMLLVLTGLLTALTTACCGPVSFIGLAVPHITRLVTRTDDHATLIPATILCGAAISLLCNVLTFLPGDAGLIPLNAVTPIIGAPVIIWVIVKGRKGE